MKVPRCSGLAGSRRPESPESVVSKPGPNYWYLLASCLKESRRLTN